jgi:hypothetical protein
MSPRIQGRSISRSIASPRSNITAFLDVTVNGVRVVVTLMLRPGTTVSVADVTPRPPEPINLPPNRPRAAPCPRMRKLIAGSRAQLGCPLCADFVAEVGGDTRVAVVTNFLK